MLEEFCFVEAMALEVRIGNNRDMKLFTVGNCSTGAFERPGQDLVCN